MEIFLFLAFLFGAFLDFVMAILGLAAIFQIEGVLGYIPCAAFALMALVVRLAITSLRAKKKELFYRCMARVALVLIFLDFYAISNAVGTYVIEKQSIFSEKVPIDWISVWDHSSPGGKIFFLPLVIFLVFSPIVLSYLAPKLDFLPDFLKMGDVQSAVKES